MLKGEDSYLMKTSFFNKGDKMVDDILRFHPDSDALLKDRVQIV
jgi:hypothetical protein